jgi:hypothetical protein
MHSGDTTAPTVLLAAESPMLAQPSRSLPHPVRRLSWAMHPKGTRRRDAAAASIALALAGLLAACSAPDDKFPPACPTLSLVPDAADVARFDGHGIDVTDLIVRGRITAVPAKCEPGDTRTTVRATLHVDADFTRGPAAPPGALPVTYFIALMQGSTVLREQDFSFAPSFAANVAQASVHGEEIELLLPVSKTKTAAAYRVFVGFRLSPAELAYNRSHTRQ